MRLATFASGDKSAIGAVDRSAETIVDLQAAHRARTGNAHPALESMLSLIEGGERALDLARELSANSAAKEFSRKLADVRLLAPVPTPQQIREFSVFEQHVRDAPRASAKIRARLYNQPAPPDDPNPKIPEVFRRAPAFYMMNRFNVVGPDADVEWPRYSEGFFDYELEIGMYLGRGGKNITRENAGKHIFGYTIFNDFSARQQQWREMETRMGPTKGKSFDTGNVTGPWIVTADELPGLSSLEVAVRVNGEEWTRKKMGPMLHDFPAMIAYISQDETLHAGELFASGTVGGCSGMEIDRWLKIGDVIELEVEGIGILRNRIVAANGKASE